MERLSGICKFAVTSVLQLIDKFMTRARRAIDRLGFLLVHEHYKRYEGKEHPREILEQDRILRRVFLEY